MSDYLTHRPPVLENPAECVVASGESEVKLDPARDHLVHLPDVVTTPVVVSGGRRVVLIGGEVRTAGRALYLHAQTEAVYVEGLKITGPDTREGINLDQRRGASVTLQNIFIEDLQGSFDGWHADALQTWAGPDVLRVDRFRARSRYQGMYLRPRQMWAAGRWPTGFDLRRVQLDAQAYALWTDGGKFPITCNDVWAQTARGGRDQWLWPKPSTGDVSWVGVNKGAPAQPFVDPDEVGVGYVSRWER